MLIETSIALADKVLNLDKSKIQDKKSIFNEIVNPLYEDLEPVASNYMEIFRTARSSFSKFSIQELKKAIVLVGKEREAMVTARIKVEQMAYQVKGLINDEEVGTFALAIIFFFHQTTQIFGLSRTRDFLEELKRIEKVSKGSRKITQKDKELIVQYIDETLATLEEYWGNITKSYSKLRIHYLGSKKLIRKM